MTGQGLKNLVENFVSALHEAREEMASKLPPSIHEGFKKYSKLRQLSKKEDPAKRKLILEKYTILKNMLTLPIYSWNGERYDMPVLLSPLIDVLSENSALFKRISVIKRGTSLMELKYGFLVFRDFINFSNPMSLGQFKLLK